MVKENCNRLINTLPQKHLLSSGQKHQNQQQTTEISFNYKIVKFNYSWRIKTLKCILFYFFGLHLVHITSYWRRRWRRPSYITFGCARETATLATICLTTRGITNYCHYWALLATQRFRNEGMREWMNELCGCGSFRYTLCDTGVVVLRCTIRWLCCSHVLTHNSPNVSCIYFATHLFASFSLWLQNWFLSMNERKLFN